MNVCVNRSYVRVLEILGALAFLHAGNIVAFPDRGVAQAAPADAVARGKYLVTIASCNDCHTPLKLGPNGPEPNMSRMLSGHPEDLPLPPTPSPQPPWGFLGDMSSSAFVGPWGVSYAANLTPDDETGIGAWDEQLFMKAMRSGKHLGAGRPIMPPMPWMNVAQMTDADLKAVFAYLQSIPAIKNHVPEYAPPAEAPKH